MPFKPMQHTDGRDVPFTGIQLRGLCQQHNCCPAGPVEAISKERYWRALVDAGVAGAILDKHYTAPEQQPQPEPDADDEAMPMSKAAMIEFAKANGIALGDYARKTQAAVWQSIINNEAHDAATAWAAANGKLRTQAQQPRQKPAQAPIAQLPLGSTDAAAQAMQTLLATLGIGGVSADMVRDIVRAELAVRKPKVERYVVRDAIERKLADGVYIRAEAQRVVDLLRARKNVMLVGPSGSGKTHFAAQIAEHLLQCEYSSNSCSAGMSESAVTGWLLPFGESGRFVYVSSLFVDRYENGGLHLIDEMDAADSNLLVFLNQALGNGHFFLPQRQERPRVERHANFYCIAAANTYGTGGDRMYVGREQLDAATLDRFWMVSFDYDAEFETRNVKPEILEWARTLRTKVASLKLRRVVSTRKLLDMSEMMDSASWTFKACRDCFFEPWSADERSKVGA